jgi:hypothetical protein
VVRKVDGKDQALVYVVYVRDTKDDNVLRVVRASIEKQGERPAREAGSRGRRPSHSQKTITKFS